MALVPLAEVRIALLALVPSSLAPVEVALADAQGLVAAADVTASEAVPAFANSAMDGYAVVAADTTGASADAPVVLAVAGRILAGHVPDLAVAPGVAVRIMTGAAVPRGADAVVPIEVAQPVDDGGGEEAPPGGRTDRVAVGAPAGAGDHVRRPGSDVASGDIVLRAGSVLGPARLGVLAQLGVESVLVYPRPRVGVLSTGDELVEGSTPLRPGQLRDSNRPALLASVAVAGSEPVDLGLVPDDADAIAAGLRRGAATCDVIVTSGGVSVGDVDLVKVVLDTLGEVRWVQIAMKPAKPFAYGEVDGVVVLGLPGNPVSSLVSFELLARPLLRRLAGHPDGALVRPALRAVADEALARHRDGKVHYARVTAAVGPDGRLHVGTAGGQGSHQLAALAAADGLAVLPDGPGAAAGDEVDVLLLTELRA
jgi:molybdenum cofactor synthesis domain-containing protein